ncbi:MAG: hypothetical protein ABI790_10535, partial [Betaproteobacteria bacterium]
YLFRACAHKLKLKHWRGFTGLFELAGAQNGALCLIQECVDRTFFGCDTLRKAPVGANAGSSSRYDNEVPVAIAAPRRVSISR